jgi:formylglycine-generating enzyme required for sulfatase activity
VLGGTYYRTYGDTNLDAALASAADGGTAPESDPATVSGFRLDKYLVTVGRFRQFVNYMVSGGALPAVGSGKHTHLNGGQGLVNSGSDAGLAYEMGWQADWSRYFFLGSGAASKWNTYLTSCPTVNTWTPSVGTQENLPIDCVSWYNAYAFCIWDGGFLPSEAEWGYAAAGGSQQREFPWGSTDPGMMNEYAVYGCNYPVAKGDCTSVANIAPVGTATLGAGLWGQVDLLGDAYEWTLDSYYYAYVNPCTDCAYLSPTNYRVYRGEGPGATEKTSWTREFANPGDIGTYYGTIGFRCARTP